MSALMNSAGRRYSAGRCAVYERLLADPAACWTVRGMAAAVPASLNVSLDAIRDVFYLLVSQGILRVLPRRHPLTFGVTRGGVPPLRRTMQSWKGGGRARGRT